MNVSVQSHPASVDAYIRHGWSLVPIPQGTKGPQHKGWNLRESALKSQADLPPTYGIGLAHAYSGTMALDIDDWNKAVPLLLEAGIDLPALYDAPDSVVIDSGRVGRGKLLFAMPLGAALPSKKIVRDGETIYELRCATVAGLTMQDVLPPSIHPDTGQPYRWAGNGHWMRLPIVPQVVLDHWDSLLNDERERVIETGGQVAASWQEIKHAIEFISPDCSRDEWINVGMALHWAGTQTNEVDQGLAIWAEWSRQSVKYPGDRGIATQWNSFKPDKSTAVTLGTLFHIAKQHGWVRPLPDVSELFRSRPAPTVSPDDLLHGLRAPPPDVDLSLFPEVLSKRAQQIGVEMGSDPLTPLFAGLAAVSGAIDARTRLELLPRYRVPPVIWLMTIGSPAQKKSPASKPMMVALDDLVAEDYPHYKKRLLAWEGKEAAYTAAKKSFLEWSASPEAMLGEDQAPAVPELDSRPAPLKIITQDITSQKLVRDVADNPRGLLCHLDEMNGWIKKLTDRTSGEDRSAWVVAYEASKYQMDRVGAGMIVAENYAVSIYGNVQPQVFDSSLGALADDGLLQRFIPVILRNRKWGIGEPIPDFAVNDAEWNNTLRLIFSIPETLYKLSPEAFDLFRDFQRWYEQAKEDEVLLQSGSVFLTAFGKLEGTCGRLMLFWHVIEDPFNPLVSASVAQRVIELVKSFVVPSLRHALDGGASGQFDQWVIEYVIQYAGAGKLTLSEIKRSARRQFDPRLSTWGQDQMVIGSMGELERAGWVIRLDDGSGERSHKAEWAIDPRIADVFKDHRDQVMQAKQRRMDEIYRLSTKPRKLVKGYTPTP